MNELKIKKEFESLIPALTGEEFAQLEQNCLQEGIRDKIVTWNNYIVDGHNRYKIANKHNLKFNIHNKEFKSEDDACVWIIRNQFGRRNLPDFVQIELRVLEKEYLLKIGKEKQKETHLKGGYKSQQNSVLSKVDKTEKHNTRQIIAKSLDKSTGHIAMAEVVIKKAPEEVKQKLRKGEMTINQAYKGIKTEEKRKEIEKQKEDIKNGKIQLPKGKYEVIVMDVPWGYGTSYSSDGRRSANPYPEMTLEEIKNIDIPASDNCILWFWTTQKFLKDSFDIVKHYGFEYKGLIVWDKQKMGMGDWLRMQTEFCLMCVKGKPIWTANDVRDIISEARREHSRKPEAFYHMVNKNCIGRKLDYFSRTKREGWDSIGNDLSKFNEVG